MDVENQYYNSKGLLEKEDGLDEALAGFQEVLEMECEDREKWCAYWGRGREWVGGAGSAWLGGGTASMMRQGATARETCVHGWSAKRHAGIASTVIT